MDASEQSEERAERFYQETHVMAPGKDEAVLSGHTPYETRLALWELWCKKEVQLAAATTRADGLSLQVRNMQSDCAEHNQDLVRAVMKRKQAEAIIQDALIEGGALDGETILDIVKNLKRVVEEAEAKLNDPIYQECCANLKKAEGERDRLATYLEGRRKAITASLAVEVLAGNSVKASNERTALIEIEQATAALRETREG